MSYPFQGGPESHPYPPSLSYPSAPTMSPGNNPYPQNTSMYPPLPSINNPQYPSSTPYPPANPGYPTSNAYPPSNPGYPTSTPGYPTSTPVYPPSNTGYPTSSPYPPSSNPGYPTSTPYPPSSNPGYPTSTPGYPTSTPYPPSSNPGYPSSTPGYPSNPYPPSNPAYSNVSPYPGYPSSNPGYPINPHEQHSGQQNPGGYPPNQYGSGDHYKTSPTVKPVQGFDSKNDAAVLRKAMKGFGTDEDAIIGVLSKRTNAQRQEIAKEFKTLYGKDLIKDLKSEISGKFEQLVVALMTPIDLYYAEEVHHAISGIGTNESAIIEVLCTLSNAELHYVKAAYEKLYKKSMESDLASDTSGNFKRLLVSLCVGRRDESTAVNHSAAESDAKALQSAGVQRFGTDESTFNAILCSRSFAQLSAIFQAYERITGQKFEKAIKSEFSGDIEDGLLAITKCVMNKAAYLAECLHKSMSGMGTNDRALIRLMVTRCEIDLGDIKREFQSKYGKSLESFIKGDASGDYKKMLIALLG